MKIQTIEIIYWRFTPYFSIAPDGITHVKTLPFLSVVQSLVGSYDIRIGDSSTLSTGEGGFFIAPSAVKQTITHRFSAQQQKMCARWLFLDARINGKYTLDECFAFPTVLKKEDSRTLHECFQALAEAENCWTQMSVLYRIIGTLISCAVHEKASVDRGVQQAVKFIHKNYAKSVNVETLAGLALMSKSNFYAAFRKRYGCSPIEYTNQIRISVAQDLLLESDKSIREIASDVGMEDPFYFSKLFKKHCGLSPRAYRNKLSENRALPSRSFFARD